MLRFWWDRRNPPWPLPRTLSQARTGRREPGPFQYPCKSDLYWIHCSKVHESFYTKWSGPIVLRAPFSNHGRRRLLSCQSSSLTRRILDGICRSLYGPVPLLSIPLRVPLRFAPFSLTDAQRPKARHDDPPVAAVTAAPVLYRRRSSFDGGFTCVITTQLFMTTTVCLNARCIVWLMAA